MDVVVVAVGRPGALLDGAIREYEARAGRYWKLEPRSVRAESAARNRPVAQVQRAEGARLLAATGKGHELVALTRTGEGWSSAHLADYLTDLALRGENGASFLIGGAYGLDDSVVREARHRLSLSAMTLPHDLARLVLAEQLYRAGTIARGEPYHKG